MPEFRKIPREAKLGHLFLPIYKHTFWPVLGKSTQLSLGKGLWIPKRLLKYKVGHATSFLGDLEQELKASELGPALSRISSSLSLGCPRFFFSQHLLPSFGLGWFTLLPQVHKRRWLPRTLLVLSLNDQPRMAMYF